MGGRGSSGGGGKGRSGGAATRSAAATQAVQFLGGRYNLGEAVRPRETDMTWKVESGESISKSINKVLDSRDVINSDGTTTRTDIIKGSKGTLYAVELTHERDGVIIKTRVRKAEKV